jgi:hypothetical protein
MVDDGAMTAHAMRIGLMADPGVPENVAASVAPELARELSNSSGEQGPVVRWEVEVSQTRLPINRQGEIPLMRQAHRIRSEQGWDYLVYLTDLPRAQNDQSMLSEASSAAHAALVSLPALGAYRLKARAGELLLALIQSMQRGTEDFPSVAAARRALGHSAVHRAAGDGDISYLVLPGRANRWRLLSGMVRSNRPGRLLTALSSCMAAAAATGAFGIFYASIWGMADAMSAPRLALVSAVVIAALSAWLILHHGLWNRIREADDRWRAGLDNAATLITVGTGVALMYGVLWAVLFVAGLVVIPPDYLQSQLGHPVTLVDYLRLSWLAASLGTMAGALGASFDSPDAIREATYSRREHERRQLAGDYHH